MNVEGVVDAVKWLKSLKVNDDDDCPLKKTDESSESTEKTPEEASGVRQIRHCAYCLNEVRLKEIKKCGKCHKRAYCSKECQVKDWSLKHGGQGHKNWCGLECGEEDMDWEVAPVQGKGLGLIAKRHLPAKYRIMVDATREMDHPKILELMPLNASLFHKYHYNCLNRGDGVDVLCLRIARANHACDANAAHHYEWTFKVGILFTEHEIAAGEESISYTRLKDVSKSMSPEFSRSMLQGKWGIICPINCICHNKEIHKLLAQTRALYVQIFDSEEEPTMDDIKKLLQNQDLLGCGYLSQAKLLFTAYECANYKMQMQTMKKNSGQAAQLKEERNEFLRQAYEIECAVSCPNSKDALEYLARCKKAGINFSGVAEVVDEERKGLKSLEYSDDCPLKKTDESSEKSTATAEGILGDQASVVRHCAFCLDAVDLKDVLKCDKCHKRAYCSKECQTNDWCLEHGGQGHQNWCGLECGEEDLDWEVAPVQGKGLGLIAKRLLPARYRIMADAVRRMDHPKIMDLMPLNGTLEEKLDINRFKDSNGVKSLCLRIARANHDCGANAVASIRDGKVTLLAERKIGPGEEICISYTRYNDISKNIPVEASRHKLKNQWGIICPVNCFCRNKENQKVLAESKGLFAQIPDLDDGRLGGGLGAHSYPVLDNVKKILHNGKYLGTGLLLRQAKLCCTAAFQSSIWIMRLYKNPKAMEELTEERKGLMKQAYELECAVSGPNSKVALKYLSYCQKSGIQV